jgi:hypothetical protein
MHSPFRRAPVRIAAVLAGALAVTGAVVASLRGPDRPPQPPTPVPPAPAIVAAAVPSRPTVAPTPVAAPPAAAPTQPSRFQLSGVVAPDGSTSRTGLALISIDGGAAHVFRVGAAVGDRVLQSVSASSASLASPAGGPPVVLELGKPGTAAAAVAPRPAASVARAAPAAPAASDALDPMTPEGSSEAPPHAN